MKKLGLLLLCFVFFLSGCSLTQNEKADRKENYETDGKKPKNLDEELLKLGFRVEYIDRYGGKRDKWSVVHVNQDEQLVWQGVKEFGGMFHGVGEFMYRTYLYGDDPDMLFYGNGEDFENSIFGVGIKEGLNLTFEDIATSKKFVPLSKTSKLYETLQGTKKWKDRVEDVEKIKKTYDVTANIIGFDNEHDFFSMKTMNVLNHSVITQGEYSIGLFEWAFIEDPYQDPELLEFEAPLIRFPMNSKDDSFWFGKDKENPASIIRHGDRLEILNEGKLPLYEDSPKINISTDDSQQKGIENKKRIQKLLYDIYQVLKGKSTVYYGKYAHHLVEDYIRDKRNFETNFYALKGMNELDTNDLNAANMSFENALKVKEGHIPALLGKAKMYLMQEQTSQAMEIYKQLLNGQLDETTAKELSIKKLAKIFVENPNDYIRIDIMKTLYQLKKDKEMKELFKENANQNTHAAISFYYAQSMFRLGECEEALKYMEKARSEVPSSIPHVAAKAYALAEITKIEAEWKKKGCVKKETETKPQEGEKQEWYITFEIDKKTKKVTLGIPEGGHVLNVKKGETIKLVEKNKDPNSYTKILFTHPNLEPNVPKEKDKIENKKSEEVTILAKEKGSGDISILPDGDWEKEHKIVVFID